MNMERDNKSPIMISKGADGTEVTIGGAKLNIYSLVIILPFWAIAMVLYYLIWGSDTIDTPMNQSLLLLIVVLVGIVLHELIHGFFFSFFAKSGLKSISFGVLWSALAFYCHCDEPLRVWQYRLTLLMPTIILGFLPFVYGLLMAHFFWYFVGVLFITYGVGDFMVLWMLRHFKRNDRVVDHSKKVGFYIQNR